MDQHLRSRGRRLVLEAVADVKGRWRDGCDIAKRSDRVDVGVDDCSTGTVARSSSDARQRVDAARHHHRPMPAGLQREQAVGRARTQTARPTRAQLREQLLLAAWTTLREQELARALPPSPRSSGGTAAAAVMSACAVATTRAAPWAKPRGSRRDQSPAQGCRARCCIASRVSCATPQPSSPAPGAVAGRAMPRASASSRSAASRCRRLRTIGAQERGAARTEATATTSRSARRSSPPPTIERARRSASHGAVPETSGSNGLSSP